MSFERVLAEAARVGASVRIEAHATPAGAWLLVEVRNPRGGGDVHDYLVDGDRVTAIGSNRRAA